MLTTLHWARLVENIGYTKDMPITGNCKLERNENRLNGGVWTQIKVKQVWQKNLRNINYKYSV